MIDRVKPTAAQEVSHVVSVGVTRPRGAAELVRAVGGPDKMGEGPAQLIGE